MGNRVPRIVFSILVVVLAAGAAWSAPAEVQGLRFSGTDTFEWDVAPGADAYNVYRGNKAFLPADYGSCIYQDLVLPDAADPVVPPPGEVYFYVITATKQAHEGTMGIDSDGLERPNLNPCFTLPPPLLDRINPNGPMFDGVWQGKESPRNPGIANDLNNLAGGGVYLHTGEQFVQEVDLRIPGSGISWQHVRYYRSQINHNGQQGVNWTFNYDRRVLPGEGSVWYMDGTGREDEYFFVSGSIWEPAQPGIYSKILKQDDGSFILRERDGTRYFHHALDGTPLEGRLYQIMDRNEASITFQYYSNGLLASAVDTLGRGIFYYWNGQARLGSVVDHTGREVRYEYDAAGDLISVRTPTVIGTSTGNDFPAGKTTIYDYSAGYADNKLNHNLASVTAPGDPMAMINNQFNPDDEISTQYYGGTNASGIAAGGQYVYMVSAPGGGTREMTIIDRTGHEHLFITDSDGRVTYEDINGWFAKEHGYNSTGERVSTLLPMGNEILYGYDEFNPDLFQRGNLLEIIRFPDGGRGDGHGGPLPPLSVEYEYEPLYTQQRVITDPKGRASEFIFDYQEGDPATNGVANMLTLWNISPGLTPLGLGEINGDGTDIQIHGNPIKLAQPDVSLLPGGRQESLAGAPFQSVETLYRFNRYGQVTTEIDPERNVTLHTYFPATDPDGDGFPTDPPLDGRALDPFDGGYLASTVIDADPSGIIPDPLIGERNNYTNPPAAEIVNDFAYDAVGNLTASVDGNGTRTHFEVNALGQIVSIHRGAVSDRSINLDPDPPLGGFVAEQIFNEKDEIVERRVQDLGDLSGSGGWIETHVIHDILGNALSVGREVGFGVFATTEHRFDAQERRISTTLPEGNIHTLLYDSRGLLDRLNRDDTDTDPSNGGGVLTDYDYDFNGNLIDYIDGEGTSWPFVYDGLDRRTRATIYPDFPAESFFDIYYEVDESIGRIEIRNSTGTIFYDADYVYDELGRTTELRQGIRDAGGTLLLEDADSDGYASVYTEYDRNSRRSRVWADSGTFTDLDLDGAGRMLLQVDPLGNAARFIYDANNNVVDVKEVEHGATGTEVISKLNVYDRLDRLAMTTDDLGNSSTLTYDSRDNLILMTDSLGNTNNYTYDGLDRRIETARDLRVGGNGAGAVYDQIIYKWVFDLNGRLHQAIDPESNTTTYSYDGLDRRISELMDDGTSIQYGYDLDDNVVSVADANGSMVTIDRDKASRIISRTVVPAPNVHANTQIYEYDPLNRLTRAQDVDDAGVATDVYFEYDSMNRVRMESSQVGANPARVLNFEYDGNGNRLAAHYPGLSLSYSYDPLNRLATVHDGIPAGYQADYTYLGPERVAERAHGNGTRKSYLSADGAIDLGYDALKRVVSLRHYDPANSAIYQTNYEYDPVGNLIREEEIHAGRESTYGYDSAYRVVEYNRDLGTAAPTQVLYTLDRVGNWLQRMINGQPFGNTPNNLNEYDEPQSGGSRVDDGVADDFDDDLNTPNPDGVNLGHDKNGNLVTENTRTYEYDALNRLVRVYDGLSPVAYYVYDGLNRRTLRFDYTDGTDHRYIHDGDLVIEERDASELDILRRYFHGIGGELVAMEDVIGLGGYYYLHDDTRGSVVMVTASDASIVERVSYDAFGEPRFEDPSGAPTGVTTSLVGNPFLYQGQHWDTETEAYENKGAIFAPRFGRHFQRMVPGQAQGPLGLGLNVPRFWPCFVNWFGMNPFWWWKAHFWHPGAWHCGWWAWKPGWWWGGPWGWWRWRPWLWIGAGAFDGWWIVKPWVFWWHHPFRWWAWRAWWPWPGWWGFFPFWGWLGWSHWIPVWGFIGWKAWWPWWGWGGWCGFWPSFGWWGWFGWWPGWTDWWHWHPWWWWGWWTWSPWWWHGYWGWVGLGFWRWCWGWLHWWPWGWWNWSGWSWWWGWFGWNPWWYWGWWSWWTWGWIRGFYWWWGPIGWGPWFGSFWPGWWWGWWWWLWPGCWLWRIGWWGFWAWPWWWTWWHGWWVSPWWGWFHWWGWWWPWWGWFG